MSGAVTVTQADADFANGLAEIGMISNLNVVRIAEFAARHRHAAEAASKQQIGELVETLVKMLPANLCLTNRTLPDDMNIPLEWDVTMGELREVAALIARAKATEQGEG